MTATMTTSAASVPCRWPGDTFVCLGSGPSLTQDDVDACSSRARVIAVKDAIRLAPWADVLYGAGADVGNWWAQHGPCLEDFAGLRYTLDPKASRWATVLRNTGFVGLETDPSGLRIGKNSGYQAINLAVHLGAKRIVLLGFDMEGHDHFCGPHPDQRWRPNYREFSAYFDTLVEPLNALGIRIINASRHTTLDCFERLSLEEALA
jgi:hypothetical protein